MLISEFIDRTGFRPTEDYYHTEIEPEYNRSNLNKDEWCKQWKKNGGIQKAYDAMCKLAGNDYAQVISLQWEIKQLTEQSDRLNQDKKELQEKLNEQIKINNDLNETMCKEADEKIEMTVFLIQQAEKWGASDLRDKVIEIMGAREYIAYKINHDLNLWQRDKDLIVELLNQ